MYIVYTLCENIIYLICLPNFLSYAMIHHSHINIICLILYPTYQPITQKTYNLHTIYNSLFDNNLMGRVTLIQLKKLYGI